MFTFEVILSPALIDNYDLKEKNVVVVDILRATSTIVTAIHYGVEHVVPCLTAEETKTYQTLGYLCAGERNGLKITDFEMGNSPFECMNQNMKNKKIALTTTNGTKCFIAAKKANAYKVFCGSFLNLKAMSDFLIKESKPVVVLCAGWKDKVNLEDSLYAGALYDELQKSVELILDCDSTLMVHELYKKHEKELSDILKKSSHYQRLSYLSHEEDMVHCLQSSVYQEVVVFDNNFLKKI